MLEPFKMIPAYPPKIIEDYIRKYDSVNVYVDLKNSLTTVFIKDIQDELKFNSRNYKGMCDSSIFQGCLAYASYWLRNTKALGKNCKVCCITDTGTSSYHTNLSSKYKESRLISNIDGVYGGMDDEIRVIRDKNFSIANKVLNKLSKTYFISLKFLESDFISHYLITRKFNQDNILHVIISSDKDMFQTITTPNIVQIYNRNNNRYLLDMNTAISKYTKIDSLSEKNKLKKLYNLKNFDINWISALMSIVGDNSDDIQGIHGLGPAKAFDLFVDSENVYKYIGTPEEQKNRILSGGNYFKEDIDINNMNSIWKKVYDHKDIITLAYKLISYESLISWLETPDKTEKKETIDYIDKILYKKDIELIPSMKALMIGLNSLQDCVLQESAIESLL
jgi:5'-3' exonuclease